MFRLIDLRLLRSCDDDVSAWFSLVVVISLVFNGVLCYRKEMSGGLRTTNRLSS